ncbi:MAG: serpin family protein [Longimicrobiales bacterium]
MAMLALCMPCLQSATTAQAQHTAAEPLSAFGLEVFKTLSQSSREPNVVFSPLSVGLAVALFSEGAEVRRAQRSCTRSASKARIGTRSVRPSSVCCRTSKRIPA